MSGGALEREARDRETPCAAPAVPGDLAAMLQGCTWARSTVGASGATVYRLGGTAGGPGRYLKHGVGPAADEVAQEALRLRWLARHVPVPAVCHFTGTAGEAWLLVSALAGQTAWQRLQADVAQQEAVVDALARFLRRLHAVPVADCPFNANQTVRLRQARARIAAGLVDAGDFDAQRRGWTPAAVLRELTALLPLPSDPVVTHGDFSPENLLLEGGEVSGCIDVARAGVADRYQDLAILWHALGELGGSLQRRLLESYGLTRIDERRMRFHVMLDELF